MTKKKNLNRNEYNKKQVNFYFWILCKYISSGCMYALSVVINRRN